MLRIEFSARFAKDYKRLTRKHFEMKLIDNVIRLISANTKESKIELKERHNMHSLKGKWAGNFECHVANIGDWLLVWKVSNNTAYMIRTGSHDDIFR